MVTVPVPALAGRPLRRAALGAALAGAVLAAAPAVAGAADLTADARCFASGQVITLSGSAFTAGAPVTIGGAVTGGAQADPAGAFTTQVAAPPITELGPTAVTVSAVDRVNPANTASLELRVVREAFGSNVPIAGRPRAVTTWRFAGFVPGRPIYAHFLLRERVRGRHRFGVATGACGTLTARAARIPGVRALRPGRWTLKLDQRMIYHEATPGSELTFRILRRPR
jgi:hypothetical protein